ncbi:MAG: hypothetical protein C0434_07735 [Xanthomonadaceae bacterium]|nr:hypothetical protein [Xanthomonadaceae bacterium]
MSADDRLPAMLARLRRAATLRALLIDGAAVLPLAGGLALLAAVLGGRIAAVTVLLAALLGLGIAAWRHAGRHDLRWLLRRLDRHCPAFEDSSALALQTTVPASPLAALQQARIRARMRAQLQDAAPELRAAWPRRRLLRLSALAVALVAVALLLPQWRLRLSAAALPAPHGDDAAATTGTQIASIRLAITPPPYTQLPQRRVDTPDARVPAGSTIEWRLRLDRDAEAVALGFHDGSRLDLRRDGAAWQGSRMIDSASLYRIELRGAAALADERGYRLDVVADQPPEIVVRAPEQTLTVIHAEQPEWLLQFDAKDDYGLGDAELTISLAQGAGDQVKVREQRLPLTGDGDAHSRRYRHRLDLKALGYGQGDDLIVRLTVADRRVPTPQRGVSPSLILRWPADSGSLSEGLEGTVQKIAPAYFRSQRQIIIDTEALLAARPTISADRLQKDADTLGVDQKILRLRYGEFLGEEFENGRPHEDQHEAKAAAAFGGTGDLLHDYGHEHNESETATLMDPATKLLLRAALNEMWQAELRLRQAQPDAALPYEYKALALIKQVQQAERIYLARTGLDLPPFDATRRLSGERDGLRDRSRALDRRADDDTPFPALLRQLDGAGPVEVAPLLAWVKAHPDVPDALGLLAEADRLRRDPACADCRPALKARLWPLLPPPPAAVGARRLPDAAARAWLDGLSGAAR